MATDYKGLTIKFEADASGVTSALNNIDSMARMVQGSLGGVQTAFTNVSAAGAGLKTLGTALTSVGDKMTVVSGLAAITFGRSIVSSATDFGNEIAKLGGYLDLSGSKLQSMSDQALSWGQQTIFSATEAAQAMNELAKGGMSEAQISGGAMEATMQLAAAGELDMATAASTAVQAINVFGLEASDASSAADALAGAANSSTASVGSLAEGFSQIGGVASMAGWDINEVTGALALLADRGFSGAEAGTTLKTMLQRLAAPTDQAKAVMEQLGISVYDADGKMVDAVEVVQQFEQALDGLTDQQRNEALLDIFGMRGINGMTALLATASDGFQEYIEATDRAGYASEMAQSRLGELGWALEILRSKAETASVNFGNALTPTIIGMADALEGAIEWFNGLSTSEQQTVAQTALVAAAAGPVISIVGRLVSTFGGFVSTLGTAGQTMATFVSYMGNGQAASTNFATALANTLVPQMANAEKRAVEVAAKTAAIQQGMTNLAMGGVALLATAVVGALISAWMQYEQHAQLVADATTGLDEAMRTTAVDMEALSEATGAYADAAGSIAMSADEIRASNDEALQSVADFADTIRSTLTDVNTDSALAGAYAETLKELSDSSSLTEGELARLKDAVDGYNDVTGAAIDIIDEQTGALNLNREQIDEVTEAFKRQAEQQAYSELYADAIKEQAKNEQELKQTTEDLAVAEAELLRRYQNHETYFDGLTDKTNALRQKQADLSAASQSLASNVEHWGNKIGSVSAKFSTVEAAMTAAGYTGEQYRSLTESQLAQILSKFDGTIKSIEGILSSFGVTVGGTGKVAVTAAEDTADGITDAMDEIGTSVSNASNAASSAANDAVNDAVKALQRANDAVYRERQRQLDKVYKQEQRRLAAEVDAQSDAFDEEYDQLKSALDKAYDERKSAADEEIALLESKHAAEEAALKKTLDAQYSERKSALDKEYKAYKKQNDQRLKDAKAQNSAETKAFKEATKERIAAIKAEYEAKKAAVAKTDGTQEADARIADLKAQTKAEQDAIKQRENDEKRADLEKAVREAKTRKTRQDAEKALSDFIANLAQESREAERDAEIERLEQQKGVIAEETKAKQEALDEERDSIINAYEQQREIELAAIEARQTEAYDMLSEQLENEEELRKAANEQTLAGYKETLDAQLEALKAKNDEAETARSEALEAELQQYKDSNDQRLEDLKEYQDTVLEEMRTANSDRLEELKNAQSDELQALKDAQSDEVDALRSSLTAANDAVSTGGDTIRDTAKAKADETTAAVEEAFTPMPTKAGTKANETLQEVLAKLGLMPGQVKDVTDTTGHTLVERLDAYILPSGDSMKKVRQEALRNIKGLPKEVKDVADKAMGDLKKGIDDSKDPIGTSSGNVADGLVNELNRKLDINSPSRVTYGIGENVGQGLADGMDAKQDTVETAASSLADKAESGLGSIDASKPGEDAGDAFSSGMQNARNFYEDGRWVANEAKRGIEGPSASQAGYDFTWGFRTGMGQVDLYTVAWNMGISALDGIKNALGINSPSREAMDVAHYFVRGAQIGIERGESTVREGAKSLGEAMLDGMGSVGGSKLGEGIAERMVDGMRSREGDLRKQARRMANVVGDAYAPQANYASARGYDVRAIGGAVAGSVTEALRSGVPRSGVTIVMNGTVVREEADIERIGESLHRRMKQEERRSLWSR